MTFYMICYLNFLNSIILFAIVAVQITGKYVNIRVADWPHWRQMLCSGMVYNDSRSKAIAGNAMFHRIVLQGLKAQMNHVKA